jgi:hypothetical protein
MMRFGAEHSRCYFLGRPQERASSDSIFAFQRLPVIIAQLARIPGLAEGLNEPFGNAQAFLTLLILGRLRFPNLRQLGRFYYHDDLIASNDRVTTALRG